MYNKETIQQNINVSTVLCRYTDSFSKRGDLFAFIDSKGNKITIENSYVEDATDKYIITISYGKKQASYADHKPVSMDVTAHVLHNFLIQL